MSSAGIFFLNPLIDWSLMAYPAHQSWEDGYDDGQAGVPRARALCYFTNLCVIKMDRHLKFETRLDATVVSCGAGAIEWFALHRGIDLTSTRSNLNEVYIWQDVLYISTNLRLCKQAVDRLVVLSMSRYQELFRIRSGQTMTIFFLSFLGAMHPLYRARGADLFPLRWTSWSSTLTFVLLIQWQNQF